MENQQVLVGRRVGTVEKHLPETKMYKVKFLDEQVPIENYFRFEHLFTLVIQSKQALTEPIRKDNIVSTHKIQHYAVKWTQWHQAINHKEVDNNKLVKFELKETLTTRSEEPISIAKIIPTRQRTFTGEDVGLIIDEVSELASQFGAEWTLKEATEALNDLKDKYGM